VAICPKEEHAEESRKILENQQSLNAPSPQAVAAREGSVMRMSQQ
jgi:hypothetical protein